MSKEILVPDIGTTAEVTVIEVLVKSGDQIEIDTPLITLESDKASMEIPSIEAGIVESVHIKINDKVKMGSVILTLKTETLEKIPEKTLEKTSEKTSEIVSVNSTKKTSDEKILSENQEENTSTAHLTLTPLHTSSAAAQKSDKLYTSPGVRRLARELNIDLDKIVPTGKKNRLQKEDLLAYIQSAMQNGHSNKESYGLPSAPTIDFNQFGETQLQPLNKIKKLTAANLHRNWLLVPHVTQFDEADITDLESFRKSQAENGLKLTPIVFIMKAVVALLKQYPQFNASLDATGENLILKKYFHLGIAVDTPEGLVVPVIRDVDKKSLSDLALELGEVSTKARKKKLLPKDMQGSCFTISSLGGIGGTTFTPIVNLPDVAILGVSKSQLKPIYQNGEFVPRLMLPLALSYDHRVIDGAEGARFIVQLSRYLSQIQLLLI